ncbi:hypothetical protein V6N13_045348 [Hibiscus sabdariffa]
MEHIFLSDGGLGGWTTKAEDKDSDVGTVDAFSGFGSEADVLPSSAQFDRARTSRLARNYSAGPRTSDLGKRAFQ